MKEELLSYYSIVSHPSFCKKHFYVIGASRSSSTTPKSSTPTSRPSSAKKIPVPSTPAKGEKELEAQVTQLNEQVCLWWSLVLSVTSQILLSANYFLDPWNSENANYIVLEAYIEIRQLDIHYNIMEDKERFKIITIKKLDIFVKFLKNGWDDIVHWLIK